MLILHEDTQGDQDAQHDQYDQHAGGVLNQGKEGNHLKYKGVARLAHFFADTDAFGRRGMAEIKSPSVLGRLVTV